jgi:hypothetical protein
MGIYKINKFIFKIEYKIDVNWVETYYTSYYCKNSIIIILQNKFID